MEDVRAPPRRFYQEKTGDPAADPVALAPAARPLLVVPVRPVSVQPMMHHLLAFDHRKRGTVYTDGKFQRAALFDRILRVVHERKWGDPNDRLARTRHHGTDDIEFEDYRALMAVLGQAAWHGGAGRAASVASFRALCKAAGLGKVLQKYETSTAGGVRTLFATFHVNPTDQGEDLFEFGHKMFGEAMTAVRPTA